MDNRGYMFLRNVASLLVDVAHVDDDLQRRSLVEKHHQLQIKRCGRCYLHRLGGTAHTHTHLSLLENELHRVRTQRVVDGTQRQTVGIAALLRQDPVNAVLSVDSNNLVLRLRMEVRTNAILLRNQVLVDETRGEVLDPLPKFIVGIPFEVLRFSIRSLGGEKKEESPYNRTISVARTIRTDSLSTQEAVVPTWIRICRVRRNGDRVQTKHTTYIVSTSAKYVATFVP